MKIEKITVNKTPEQPDGVEIDLVKPEDDLQGRILSYLLTSAVREANRDGRINYDLPDRITVKHSGEGTFVVTGSRSESTFYEQSQPLAILGISSRGNRFELIHAKLKPQNLQNQRVQPPPSTEPLVTAPSPQPAAVVDARTEESFVFKDENAPSAVSAVDEKTASAAETATFAERDATADVDRTVKGAKASDTAAPNDEKIEEAGATPRLENKNPATPQEVGRQEEQCSGRGSGLTP